MPSSASADWLAVWMNSRCGGVSRVCSASAVMPITAFIGVRISWLMLARNSPLATRRRLGPPAGDVELGHHLRQPLGRLRLLLRGPLAIGDVARRGVDGALVRRTASPSTAATGSCRRVAR